MTWIKLFLPGLHQQHHNVGKDMEGMIQARPFPYKVKEIRAKYGLSQIEFCKTFGFGLKSLKAWESGAADPFPGVDWVLLIVLYHNPESVKRTFGLGPRNKRITNDRMALEKA